VNAGAETLSEAIEWLLEEVRRTPYGRLSIGVQLHSGQIAKVFKSVEESTLASQAVRGRAEDGRGQ
jgi:hypothetical protein